VIVIKFYNWDLLSEQVANNITGFIFDLFWEIFLMC